LQQGAHARPWRGRLAVGGGGVSDQLLAILGVVGGLCVGYLLGLSKGHADGWIHGRRAIPLVRAQAKAEARAELLGHDLEWAPIRCEVAVQNGVEVHEHGPFDDPGIGELIELGECTRCGSHGWELRVEDGATLAESAAPCTPRRSSSPKRHGELREAAGSRPTR
jgi:hypothetical protein